MGHYIQVLLFVIIGVILLWLGYTLFFRLWDKIGGSSSRGNLRPKARSKADDNGSVRDFDINSKASRTCPVCSSELGEGEQVKTTAFPALNNSKDRLMHIHGCIYCLSGGRKRVCPVCGAELEPDEFLAARIFQRVLRRSHVHVLGCPRCRKVI